MIKILFVAICLLSPILEIGQMLDKTYRATPTNNTDYRIHNVVLDAGHGGRDEGCSGKHSKEKHLALNITLALGQKIMKAFPDVNVIYTRTTDVFVPLYQRAAIANETKADLFISIHCNAMRKLSHIKGTETFVMGIPSTDNATASRENQSVLLEENYQQRYSGFDADTNEGHIFTTIFQNAYLDRSILLAEKIEKYVKHSRRKSRGVRQDDFVVLRETTMPSVLIETGFLTNEQDEQYLQSENGQRDMANAIFLAFKEYKEAVEKEATDIAYSQIIEEEAPATSQTEVVAEPTNQEPVTEKVYLSTPVKKEIIPVPHRAKMPTDDSPANAQDDQIERKAPPLTAEKKIVISQPNAADLYYSVQLAASPTLLDTNHPKWQQLEDITVRQENTLYKYLSGHFSDYESAAKNRLMLSQLGFKGAFVVAYKDGKRVAVK